MLGYALDETNLQPMREHRARDRKRRAREKRMSERGRLSEVGIPFRLLTLANEPWRQGEGECATLLVTLELGQREGTN